ncbi:MAG: hypothetical protein ACRDTD_06545 [Pseudonocardiaceae bacterium]
MASWRRLAALAVVMFTERARLDLPDLTPESGRERQLHGRPT